MLRHLLLLTLEPLNQWWKVKSKNHPLDGTPYLHVLTDPFAGEHPDELYREQCRIRPMFRVPLRRFPRSSSLIYTGV